MVNFKLSIGLPTIILAIIAYLTYGTVNAILAIILLLYLSPFTWIASLFPFFGISLQRYFLEDRIFSWVFQTTGIQATWLTDWLFAGYMLIGHAITIITSLVVIVVVGAIIWAYRE
jgi:hypothetical protein